MVLLKQKKSFFAYSLLSSNFGGRISVFMIKWSSVVLLVNAWNPGRATQKFLASAWCSLFILIHLIALFVWRLIYNEIFTSVGFFSKFARAMIKTSVSTVLTTTFFEATTYATFNSIFVSASSWLHYNHVSSAFCHFLLFERESSYPCNLLVILFVT